MENKELRQARLVFDTLCELLDKHGFKYDKDEEQLSIGCVMKGDDIPMNLIVRVQAAKKLISLISPLPFEVPENKRAEMALAVSVINYALADGSFDYNFLNGRILFRLTSSFRDSLIGENLFMYMLAVSTATVDKYNDRLFMVCKRDMGVNEMIEFIKGGEDE